MMGHSIVKKLTGLEVIAPLIKSNKANLQKSVVALVGNLTNNPGIHRALGKKLVKEIETIKKVA